VKTKPELPGDLIGVAEAARLLRVHVSCIYRWLHTGKLPAWRVVGRWWLSRADVLAVPEQVGPGVAQASTPSHAEARALLRRAGYDV
jgi:excisionase family DNA binding protein